MLFGFSIYKITYDKRKYYYIFIAIFLLFYIIIAFGSDTNIGNRHILPVYPFVALISAIGVADSLSLKKWRSAIVVLLFWQFIGTILIAPNFISYFNEIVGGPRNGYKYLVDSNVDWGQDLKLLSEYRNKHLSDKFYVSYFGAAVPTKYLQYVYYLPNSNHFIGEKKLNSFTIPSGSLVAISVTSLSGVYGLGRIDEENFLKKLRHLQPIDTIGYSIHIYRMP